MAVGTYMTNTLTATITGTEKSTGNVPINRGLGNLAIDSTFSEFCTYQLLASGDNTIVIPNAKAYQIYVKNNDPTFFVIVKYTPTGGVQQLSSTLGPGDIFMQWQSISGAPAAAGITALVLNASGANCEVEYFLGG
jgi:hypothetical protein